MKKNVWLNFTRFSSFLNKDYKRFLDYENMPFKKSAAMDFGTLLHTLLLEPENILGQETSGDKISFKLRGYNNMIEMLRISKEEYAEISEIVEMMKGSEMFANLLNESDKEKTFFSEIPLANGGSQKWRVKPDIVKTIDGGKGLLLLDVKTTNEQTPEGIIKSMRQYHYGYQAVIYSKVLSLLNPEVKCQFGFVFYSKPSKQIFFISLDQQDWADLGEQFDYHHQRAVDLLNAHREKPRDLIVYRNYEDLLEDKIASPLEINLGFWYHSSLK